MKLFFFRHGKADPPDWTGPDDERPLTKKGKREVRKVAKRLARLDIEPIILTSPLPRASQTAAIAGRALEVQVREDDSLRPGFNAKKLEPLIKKHAAESIMVVGHEPDFTETISQLTGATTKLSKAGVALVDLNVATMRGQLLWLLPPKILSS